MTVDSPPADSPPADSTPADCAEPARARVPGWSAFWILFVTAIAFDWCTKSWATEYHLRTHGFLARSMPIDILEVGVLNLQLVREYNNGMAFGLLQDVPNAYWYLGAIRAAAVVVLLWLVFRSGRRSGWQRFAFGAVAAGSAGNLLDNIFNREFGHEHTVQDFLLVSISSRSLPAFNVADVYVTIGAVTFLLLVAGASPDRSRVQASKSG
jgi:signal peptidase II